MSGIRVVVVDDDALVRTGLRLVLEGSPDLRVVGEAADGAEGERVVRLEAPDVVLLDLRMPRRDGLTTLRTLRDGGSRVPVVVLTTFDTDDHVLAALRAGAAGFLLKDTPPEDLVAAVRRAAAGEPVLSPSVTSRLIAAATSADDSVSRAARRLLDRLTDRERAVAEAVARGLSNQEIGVELHLGTATVKTHLGAAFTKLGATNRVQVARVVHEAGLGEQGG